MKKRMMMIAYMMMAIYNMVLAEDRLTISDFKIAVGETKDVEILLANEADYVAFQFDVYLPDGITIESYSATNRIPESTTLDMMQLSDGAYRFIASAISGESLSGVSGSIITLKVKTSDNITYGEKTGFLRKVKLSKADATGPTYAEFSFPITVVQPSVITVKSVSRTYGETNPTFEYTVTGGALEGEPIITCEAGPTSAVGNYTIKISKGSVTNYNVTLVDGTLTVTKASLTIKAGEYSKKYGDDNPTFIATYEGFMNNETEAVLEKKPTFSCEATKDSPVGEFIVIVSGAEAANYEIINKNGKLTITVKKVDNPSIILSETNYTYDSNAKEPIVTVKDGDITIPATEYSVSYTNNTNVGTATVTITDVDGGNYAVSGSATFTISAADGSLTAPSAKSDLVYNGTAQDLIIAGSSTTGTVQYSLDGTTYAETIPQGTNAGSYTVFYKVKGDANHNDIAAQNFQVSIAAKTVESPIITLSETIYTYDGTAKEPTVAVKDGETTIPATEFSVSYTNNTNAGTATVTITDVEGGNYAVSGSTTFTISAADGSLTAPTGKSDLVYNGSAQNLINAGSSTTGTLEYSLDGTTYAETIPQGTDAGSYTVYYKVTGDANHNDIAAQHFDVKIAKAALTVSAGDYEIYEGDEIPSFEVKYEGFVNNETADALITKPTISCEATVGSKPDEYKITVSGAEAKNYEITHVNGKLTILAKSFVAGGDDNKDEDDSATYQVNNQGGDGDTPPTVAITDDKDVSGSFAIPESVTYQNKTYTVTEIGEGAFENNKNLTNVSIPSSITNIGDKAFKGCSNLKSITVNITTPISLSAPAATRRMMTRTDGSSVFDGVDMATCILYVPEGSVELYKAAPVWCEFQNIMPLSSTGIKDILMPDGEAHDIYNLQGRKVKAKATSLEGLSPGVYIINGKKTILK